MRIRYAAILIAVAVIIGIGTVSPAFAAFTITMETDSDVYDHSSVITVTGQVNPTDPNGSDVTIIVERVDPVGLVQIDQISVNSDGSFSTTINTINAKMKYDTTYLIKAQYVDVMTTVAVELTNAAETYNDVRTAEAGTSEAGTGISPAFESLIGQLEYELTCSPISPSFYPIADESTLEVHIEGTNDGVLEISLHEEIIKPLSDGSFVVFVDGQQVDFGQDGNMLTIPCKAGDKIIAIVGSWAIPEFGTIAMIVLAVAIVSIIIVSTKTKLGLVSRY